MTAEMENSVRQLLARADRNTDDAVEQARRSIEKARRELDHIEQQLNHAAQDLPYYRIGQVDGVSAAEVFHAFGQIENRASLRQAFGEVTS